MSSLKSSPGIKNSVSFDSQQIPSSSVGQMIVVSTGLYSSVGGSSQTSQGSYRRAMENIITDYRYTRIKTYIKFLKISHITSNYIVFKQLVDVLKTLPYIVSL